MSSAGIAHCGSVRGMLVACWALATALGPFAPSFAGTPMTLQVEVSQGFPGLNRSALSRFIAVHMAEAGLADWRFKPAPRNRVAADRVEWIIKLNPYAGGEVRNFTPSPSHEDWFGRSVTIEARLYLGGEYQTVVEEQATIRGGPDHLVLASCQTSNIRPTRHRSAIPRRLARGRGCISA